MTARDQANEIDDLVRVLGSRHRPRVDEVRARLILIGERAVPALIADLESRDTRRRIRVLRLLALIRDPRAREPLLNLLHDSSRRIRIAAARGLARYPDDRTVAALNRLLSWETAPTVRVAATQALIELYAAGCEGALSAPMRLLVDTRQPTPVRIAAAALLRHLNRSQQTALSRRLADDPSEELRRALRRWVEARRTSDAWEPRDVARWLRRLGDDDYAVWCLAVDRLRAVGAEAVLPLVRAMRQRPNDLDYCARTAMVLKSLGPRRCGDLARALEETDEPLPLKVLLDVIAAHGQRSLIYRLKDLIHRLAGRPTDGCGMDPYRQVRARAHLELARVGSRVAVDDLCRTLGQEDRPLEPEFAAAASEIGTRAELPLLLDAWRRERQDSRGEIASAIRRIVGRERIRRNDRFVRDLEAGRRRALERILPPGAGGSRRPGAHAAPSV